MKQSSERELVPSTYRAEIRSLYRVAMLIFLVTVGIGLLNGLDVVDFDRATLLTHVHAGTLGWITLSVFAFTLWLWQAGAAPSWQRRRSPPTWSPSGSAMTCCGR
jgi:hypothetical protein